jgi:hypothetical protein
MEGIEEAVDRLDQRVAGIPTPGAGTDDRLAAVENQLAKLGMEISNLASSLDATPAPLPREQERLKVDEPVAVPKPSKPKKKPAKKK